MRADVPRYHDGMRRWFWILDAIAVLSFAVIGSDFHGFTFDVVGIVGVAAPFLVAQAVAAAVLRSRLDPLSILTGLLVALITLAGGMLLRRFIWGDGTPWVFILVAGGYFVCAMVGWRIVARGIEWTSRR